MEINVNYLHYMIPTDKLHDIRCYTQEIPPRNIFPNMTAYNYLKIVRIKSGKGIWRIDDVDYKFSAGDIYILSINEKRAHTAIYEPESLIMEVLEFLPVYLFPNIECADIFYRRESSFQNLLPRNNPTFEKCNRLFDEIINETKLSRIFKEEYIHSKIISLVISITRVYAAHSMYKFENRIAVSVQNYQILSDAIIYIINNPSEDLSVKSIAEKYNISARFLVQLFKRFVGISLTSYVRRCRIRSVFEYLAINESTILNAALECGFNSSAGFYKAVKEITGFTPTQLKKHWMENI